MGRLLQEIPREDLSAWLVNTAKALPDFGKRLNLFIARHSPPEVALAQYRATLETLIKSRNRNPLKRAREAAQHFDGLIVAIAAEFEAGRMEVVMAVCVDGIRVLNGFLSDNADPKGKLLPLVEELSQLHFMAATELRPNQDALAIELVDVGQEAALTRVFREAAYTYRDVLGEAGLARYRLAIEPYWEALHSPRRMQWHQREQVRGQMLAWARAQEDPAVRATETGRILAAVAGSAADFLHSAKSLLRAREDAAALAAAEKGFALALKSPYLDDSLLDLAVMRMERSTPLEAVEIAWLAFGARPEPDSYSLLRQAAVAVGAEMDYWARAVQRFKEVGSVWSPPIPAAK